MLKSNEILRAQQVMKLKFSNSKNNIFFKLITCLVHSNYLVLIITSHLLFLKVHFLVKPNAYLLGKFPTQRGREVDPDIVYNCRPSCIADVEKKACVVQYNLTWLLSPHAATPEIAIHHIAAAGAAHSNSSYSISRSSS